MRFARSGAHPCRKLRELAHDVPRVPEFFSLTPAHVRMPLKHTSLILLTEQHCETATLCSQYMKRTMNVRCTFTCREAAKQTIGCRLSMTRSG